MNAITTEEHEPADGHPVSGWWKEVGPDEANSAEYPRGHVRERVDLFTFEISSLGRFVDLSRCLHTDDSRAVGGFGPRPS